MYAGLILTTGKQSEFGDLTRDFEVEERNMKGLREGMKKGQVTLDGRNQLRDRLGKAEEKYVLPNLTATDVR